MADEKSDFSATIVSEALRKRIEETNYGRDAGWIVEYENQPVALFTDSEYYDMFWNSYHITWLIEDSELLSKLQNPSFWYDPQGIVIRNREFSDIPNLYFILSLYDTNTAVVRGLYLLVESPETLLEKKREAEPKSVWERFKSWLIS